jgi:predicted amidohydrolase YtcJ
LQASRCDNDIGVQIFRSNSPTAPYALLQNLYVATSCRLARSPCAKDELVNANFRLDIAQAVCAATSGAAYSCFAEEQMGSLEVGKVADFVVVDME